MQRLHVRVRGRVQRVYFRASTQELAMRLGLSGWVRNCPDGSVELIAEGPVEALEQLLVWCQHGPDGARVDACESSVEPASGEFPNFAVLR
jgi:acylphosphatase